MLKKIMLAVAFVFVSSHALATPITGDLQFFGTAVVDRSDDGSEFESIDWGYATVAISTGSFDATATEGSTVTLADPWAVEAPTAELWSVGGFTFNLEDIFLNDGTTVRGRGVISDASGTYEDTIGFWEFTTQGSGDGLFTWSSTADVPEPSSLALIGLGLLGLGVSRRRMRQ